MIFNFFTKKYINFLNKKKTTHKKSAESSNFALSKDIEENLKNFKKTFLNSSDVKFHKFNFGPYTDQTCALIYIDGLVDGTKISEEIIKPVMQFGQSKLSQTSTAQDYIENVLFSCEAKVCKSASKLIDGCTMGDTIMLINGINQGVCIGTKGFETRNISEPQTESVVRGPREGFNENLRTNTSLLRRKIKNPNFVIESLKKGNKTNTDICIAYLNGVANKKTIKQVKQRIQKIKIDNISDAGYIEELIEDYPFTLFPTIGYTEKPDVVAAKILEGRIAVIVDGSPFALTIPYLFNEIFQTSEDYYMRPLAASIFRLLRIFTFFIAVFGVPVYLAFTTFHQELVPTTLLYTIAAAREGTPFPAFLEALILIVSFEILRESGLRLPRQIGQAISIVGALIMGEAAVSAGLVGPPMVIVVAVSAVATFATPEVADVATFLRIIMLVAAATLGGFGVTMGMIGLLIHLCKIKSFDTDYFTMTKITSNSKDEFVRMPLWTMLKRPQGIANGDITRVQTFIPPPQVGDEDE